MVGYAVDVSQVWYKCLTGWVQVRNGLLQVGYKCVLACLLVCIWRVLASLVIGKYLFFCQADLNFMLSFRGLARDLLWSW